jgi:hypothetical protein
MQIHECRSPNLFSGSDAGLCTFGPGLRILCIISLRHSYFPKSDAVRLELYVKTTLRRLQEISGCLRGSSGYVKTNACENQQVKTSKTTTSCDYLL